MKVSDTPLVGLKLIVPDVFPDNRGYFVETYHATKYDLEGLDESFVQDNLSHSKKNVLRGLHYQYPGAQGKLIYVTQGEIFDVAVDIRKDSPTLGKWYAVTLSAQNHRQLYISPGFAHGFCVLSDTAEVIYKCTDFYNPAYEHTLLWNDPTLAITWPVAQPIISEKDAGGKRWQEAMLLG
ncbi:MAG TPA: dTDP-4-dehydrorhamnose 3,5-epimerase [Acidiferrobacterales bacterium]|nr:dTDP-4-dehydrorhamnose 3,5-epimerase [Acidiferrobacterales bacterium]